jgi:hypothetical protein
LAIYSAQRHALFWLPRTGTPLIKKKATLKNVVSKINHAMVPFHFT